MRNDPFLKIEMTFDAHAMTKALKMYVMKQRHTVAVLFKMMD